MGDRSDGSDGSQRTRIGILITPLWAPLLWLVGATRSLSFVELDGPEVRVRFGIGFVARFPRSAVAAVAARDRTPLAIGVHGWRGKWLVNGSGKNLVEVSFRDAQRGFVLGVPVRLRVLTVSSTEPAALMAALRP